MANDKKSADKDGNMASESGPLGLSGNQYWDDPLSYNGDIGVNRLFNKEEGMVIDAPPQVYVDEYNSIPLICLRTIAKHKIIRYSLQKTTQLVVVHLETGRVTSVKLRRSADSTDDNEPSRGFMNEWHVADLQESTKPWKPSIMQIASYPGKNLLTLLCGPEQSNQRIIEIIPDKASEKNGDYQAAIHELRHASPPPDISSALQLSPTHLDPPPPGEDMLWEITKEKEGEDDYRVSILYRVQALPSFVYPEELRPKDAEQNQIYAALPVHVVIFDGNRSAFASRPIVLPVITPPQGESESPVLSGHVSFLLSKVVDFTEKQYLYAWFICMDQLQLVEIELEEGWTDGLVPPPAPVPVIIGQ